MKQIVLTTLFLASTLIGFGQSFDDRTYSKAKIYLKDHRILKVNKLEIKGNEVSFLNARNREHEVLLVDKLNFIKIPKGSHLWEGALYGAATMALATVYADAQTDAFGNPINMSAELYVGFTAGGAALGALVGSMFPKWKEIYSGGKFLGLNLPINLGLDAQFDLAVIKITIPL